MVRSAINEETTKTVLKLTFFSLKPIQGKVNCRVVKRKAILGLRGSMLVGH